MSNLDQAFIRAYRAIGNFRGDAQFYTWLYRIAVNTAKKGLVELKRDPVIYESAMRAGDDDDETSSPGEELTADETPETAYAAKEIAQAVSAVVDALPEVADQPVEPEVVSEAAPVEAEPATEMCGSEPMFASAKPRPCTCGASSPSRSIAAGTFSGSSASWNRV